MREHTGEIVLLVSLVLGPWLLATAAGAKWATDSGYAARVAASVKGTAASAPSTPKAQFSLPVCVEAAPVRAPGNVCSEAAP